MGKITFILGGARSGKSQYAAKLAKEKTGKVAFVATGQPKDKEMKKRILLHKKHRPGSWKTYEEAVKVSDLLKKNIRKHELVIIDCLTLLVSNLLLKNAKEKAIYSEVDKILGILGKAGREAILVANDVGLGVVPANALSRTFRDIAGRVNQKVAEKSHRVYLMVAGIPLKIK